MSDEADTKPAETPEEQVARILAAHKCKMLWVWVGGVWTNRVRCCTCGAVRETA